MGFSPETLHDIFITTDFCLQLCLCYQYIPTARVLLDLLTFDLDLVLQCFSQCVRRLLGVE